VTPEETYASFRRHGGGLAAARAAFPSAPLPWLDLSTSVNPHPWQGGRASVRDLHRLPDPAATAALEDAAARAFGVARSCVAAVPGSDMGLRLLPALTGARDVAVASPTYSGHGEAWTTAGRRVTLIDRREIPSHAAEAIVLVNPNNPDGARLSRADVLATADKARARGAWLIVDEAFAEVAPDASVVDAVHDRLIVLRSFGKFYGLPGVRLGFVVAAPEVTQRVRAMTGDWPVSADAVAAGCAAYADVAWREKTRARLQAGATKLDRFLIASGLDVVGGTALFRLVSTPRAADYFQHLGCRGILVRPFDHNPSWLRFGLPPDSQWRRVKETLAECAALGERQ